MLGQIKLVIFYSVLYTSLLHALNNEDSAFSNGLGVYLQIKIIDGILKN